MPVTLPEELLVITIGTGVVVVPTAVVPSVVQLMTVRGPAGGLQDPVPLYDPVQFDPPPPVAPPVTQLFHDWMFELFPSHVPA